ncbi:hypothetical protein OH492_13835 [Vibrio chagasii]|nr:hypothetical protein [Vibrio chagasii]
MTKASLTAAISLPLLAGCVTPGEDDQTQALNKVQWAVLCWV